MAGETETSRQTLERMGATKVRHLVTFGGLPMSLVNEAAIWLAELDDSEVAARRKREEEQDRITRSAERAAWSAARWAKIAVFTAVILGAASILTTIIVAK